MSPLSRFFLPVLVLLSFGGPVLAGDGIALTITNDGTEDILVTVYDNTMSPRAVVLSNLRINGFTTIPLSVSPDATGRANLSWTAVTADSRDRKCGHAERVGLAEADSVSVHADSTCGASPPVASASSPAP